MSRIGTTGGIVAPSLRLAIVVTALAIGVSPMTQASAPRPAISIVAFGDSTTAGTPAFRSPIETPPRGAGDEHSQYAYWLMRQHPEWTVLNRGVNGERSDEIAARFDRDVLGNHPRAVIILAGVNDIYQGLPAAKVIGQLRAMYDRAEHASIQVLALTILPYNTATGPQNAAMHDVNAWIARETTRDSHLAFVDTRRAVSAPGNPDRLASSRDGLHPDIAGYRRMAEAIG